MTHFSEQNTCELGIEGFFCFFFKVNLIGKDTTTEIFGSSFSRFLGGEKRFQAVKRTPAEPTDVNDGFLESSTIWQAGAVGCFF